MMNASLHTNRRGGHTLGKNRLLEIMASGKTYPMLSAATVLWGASKLYGGLMQLRRKLYEKQMLPSYRLPCPVVSVGNLALGGTGKTPTVIHLARLIKGLGYRVAIISRGYRGTAQNKGAIVSDGHTLRCGVVQSGDEPYLMASLLEDVPVVVGKDRCQAGKTASRVARPDVILLDDAFQHLRVKRDLNLLLLDARNPIGNTFVIPRGRLREPASAIGAADAVVLTRSDAVPSSNSEMVLRRYPSLPVFRSIHSSVIRGMAQAGKPLPLLHQIPAGPDDLNGLNLFAFAGLADNPAFFDTLACQGARLVGALGFADHHDYNEKDVCRIGRCAASAGADYLVTTDKDYVRFAEKARFPMATIVLGVEIEFHDDDRWRRFIMETVASRVHRRKASC
jgi:tetraacyldisaccharide 4'-kinase